MNNLFIYIFINISMTEITFLQWNLAGLQESAFEFNDNNKILKHMIDLFRFKDCKLTLKNMLEIHFSTIGHNIIKILEEKTDINKNINEYFKCSIQKETKKIFSKPSLKVSDNPYDFLKLSYDKINDYFKMSNIEWLELLWQYILLKTELTFNDINNVLVWCIIIRFTAQKLKDNLGEESIIQYIKSKENITNPRIKGLFYLNCLNNLIVQFNKTNSPIVIFLQEYNNDFNFITKIKNFTFLKNTEDTCILLNDKFTDVVDKTQEITKGLIDFNEEHPEFNNLEWKYNKFKHFISKKIISCRCVVNGSPLWLSSVHSDSSFGDSELIIEFHKKFAFSNNEPIVIGMDANCTYMNKLDINDLSLKLLKKGNYYKFINRISDDYLHYGYESPLNEELFFTVNKERTILQPQQIKANIRDISTKDFIISIGLPKPMISKVKTLEIEEENCFLFDNTIILNINDKNCANDSSLMPNVINASDHALICSTYVI